MEEFVSYSLPTVAIQILVSWVATKVAAKLLTFGRKENQQFFFFRNRTAGYNFAITVCIVTLTLVLALIIKLAGCNFDFKRGNECLSLSETLANSLLLPWFFGILYCWLAAVPTIILSTAMEIYTRVRQ